jgi:hypothetical protein
VHIKIRGPQRSFIGVKHLKGNMSEERHLSDLRCPYRD